MVFLKANCYLQLKQRIKRKADAGKPSCPHRLYCKENTMHNNESSTHTSSFSVGKMLIAVLFFLTKIAIEFKVISALWIPKLPAAILHNIDLIYYSFFFTLFIFVYRNKLMLWCQDLKSNFNRHKKNNHLRPNYHSGLCCNRFYRFK